MRGAIDDQGELFVVIDVESRIRKDHPLRPLKKRVDEILDRLDDVFAAAYSKTGRPSVPPERLLKALILMAVYSVRSERQLIERIDTDMLFRWFLDMSLQEDVFDATVFCHNRKRLDEHGITGAFFEAVVDEAISKGLCSDEHFSVDGTLIESMASMKSLRSRDQEEDDEHDSNSFQSRNPDVEFSGQKRSNRTHQSHTDPEAKLYRKGLGKETKLCHMGHLLTENRNNLILETSVTEANGTAERKATLEMLDRHKQKYEELPFTLGADKGYDSGAFLVELERRGIVPHVAMRSVAPSKVKNIRKDRSDGVQARKRMVRRMKYACFRNSQRLRRKMEECFGWLKTIAGLDRSRWVGRWKLKQFLEIGSASYNLIRMNKLIPC